MKYLNQFGLLGGIARDQEAMMNAYKPEITNVLEHLKLKRTGLEMSIASMKTQLESVNRGIEYLDKNPDLSSALDCMKKAGVL